MTTKDDALTTMVDGYKWSALRVKNLPLPVASQYIRTCSTSETLANDAAESIASRMRSHLETVCRLTLQRLANSAAVMPWDAMASRSLSAKPVINYQIYHLQHLFATDHFIRGNTAALTAA
jgi:hypothetical protein